MLAGRSCGDFPCIRPSFRPAAQRRFRSGSLRLKITRRCATGFRARPGGSPRAAKFEPKPGQSLLLPGPDGALSGVLFGLEPADKPDKDRFLPGRLPGLLPAGIYRFANAPHDARLAALAFALGSYKFTRYRKADTNGAQLEIPEGIDGAELSRIAEGVALARDLINTPANDLGPAELEQAARDLAHGMARAFRRPSARACSSTTFR